MRIILIIITYISIILCNHPDYSHNWMEVIENDTNFIDVKLENFLKLDFSAIFSNVERFSGDNWQTYIGVFGKNYQRIDFHLIANKSDSCSKKYYISGKNKLQNNIRPLIGEINLLAIRKGILNFGNNYFVVIFSYQFNEPGNKRGDGIFSGIGVSLFEIFNDEIDIFWSESGDFSEYHNTFVGIWTQYNSKIIKKCIFSYHTAGLYYKLPFCNDFYKENKKNDFPYYYKINEKYLKYGWIDYDADNKKINEDWWKID